ncbi:hypothetical protein MPSEU_000210500 [Mayamaea pseudoterrestris]|nr:hypothetical protein MPSEU_000210500 [Mayamaea pseudoterrestris]
MYFLVPSSVATSNETRIKIMTEHVSSLIASNNWDQLYEFIESNPITAIGEFPPYCTRLHQLCSIGSAPVALIDLVARIDPSAIIQTERMHGDTCLHIIARNSQISATKLKSLLGHLEEKNRDGMLIRNMLGGTALHSAANHNAVLEAFQILVISNVQIIRMTTLDGTHAISTLWNSFIQTIPGTMLVARMLKQAEAVHDPLFERFWSKAEFLALEYVRFLGLTDVQNISDSGSCVLHGLLKLNAVIKFFEVALKRNRAFALARDVEGNLPIHRLLEYRPYRLKERDAIRSLLEAAPEAAMVMNDFNDCPLLLAIRNRIPWENGVDIVAQQGRDVIAIREVKTRLLPFQYAAFIGGRVAVETTFQLLIMRPDLLKC